SAPPVVVGGAGARPPPVSPGRLPPCVEDGPSGRRVRPEPGLVFELLDQQFSDLARPALLDPETDRGWVQVDHAGEPGLAQVGAPAVVRLGALALRVCPVEPVDTLAEGHAVAPSRTISAASSGEMSPFATQYPSSDAWPQHSTRTATSFGRSPTAARRAAASASNTPASSHWLTRCASPLDSHARAVPITSPPCAQSP